MRIASHGGVIGKVNAREVAWIDATAPKTLSQRPFSAAVAANAMVMPIMPVARFPHVPWNRRRRREAGIQALESVAVHSLINLPRCGSAASWTKKTSMSLVYAGTCNEGSDSFFGRCQALSFSVVSDGYSAVEVYLQFPYGLTWL